ncbi:MAG: family 20 glycosylhydrolase [Bacteroidales bacterium]|nr:family 20 glycosylhydrolase [Bacteroidales bacterium]HOY39082.1 glycoside hydrolase family 20 zincin-like fold domain-containing protein [Bacteroidales bacterium]
MKKRILFVIVFTSLAFCLTAQVKLIPTPQRIDYKNTSFRIYDKTALICTNVDLFYAEELSIFINQEMSLQLNNIDKPGKSSIELIRLKNDEELINVLNRNKLDSEFRTGAEGYVLDISEKRIMIIALTDAGIFYGIQTLQQLIAANRTGESIPCLTIYDYPDFAVRAWQDDISRGPIPTMELLKEQIRQMASYKLNYFYLYIEHVFKLENHTGIAPNDGITKEQIEELTAYASKYHVQLIGGYQSFGHMEKTLKLPEYQHLAENSHIISPAVPETYKFLSDVYDEIVPVFNSAYFNINCDETFGLGEGKSKSMVDSMGIDGVYIYHINKLNELLKKYNKKVLMWGDIVGSYPNSVKKLPEDITVIVWGYHAAESFDYAINPISSTGINFWVAPGINCWSNIFPNFYETKINVYNFIRDGYKHKASGVLNTSWDDDGSNLFNNNWHGFIWGAENSWKAPVCTSSTKESEKEMEARYNEFNIAYDGLFYGLNGGSITKVLVSFSRLHQSGVRDILRNGNFFEPIFPIYNEYVSDEMREKNLDLLNQLEGFNDQILKLEPQIKRNNKTIAYLKFAMKQVEFSLKKNLLRIDLYQYLNGSTIISDEVLKSKIIELINEAGLLKNEYADLWNKESRPDWLEVNLKKFDALISDLENLEGYCIISADDKITDQGRKITMRSLFGDLPVYYSINEEAPDFSKKYTELLVIDYDANIKAHAVKDGKSFNATEYKILYHKGIGRLHKMYSNCSKYHPSYDGGGKYALLDGKQGEPEFLRSGKWQGFSGQNIDIEIDLEKPQSFNSFSMGFYQNIDTWVIFPKKIEIFVKNNIADEYVLLRTLVNEIGPEAKGELRQDFTAEFTNVKTRYIRVVAYYYGKLPEWHHAGSGYESMIFADEIIIK